MNKLFFFLALSLGFLSAQYSFAASTGCSPSITPAGASSSQAIIGKDNKPLSASLSLPEGTQIYDFSTKQMYMCNGSVMTAVSQAASASANYGGFACGSHSATAAKGTYGKIVQDATCDGHDPINDCPAGYIREIVCDDNKSYCGSAHYVCFSDPRAGSSTLPPGSMCGMYSMTDLKGTFYNNPPYPSVVKEIDCGGLNPQTSCPTGYTQKAVCDDNGSWCGNVHYTCFSNAAGSMASAPSGTLCGWHSTSGENANGTYGPISTVKTECQGYDPMNACPSGYSQKVICDDNGSWCGSAYFSCAKN